MSSIILKLFVYSSFFLTQCYGQGNKMNCTPKAIELNNKAADYLQFQNYDSALFYLDKAIELDSSYYIAYSNKGAIYCTLKNYRKALIETKKVLVIKPDLAEAWVIAGMLSDKIGDTLHAPAFYKTSIEIFERRIADPNKTKQSESNSINRALSLILIGQEREGREEFRRLTELYPNNKMLGQLLNLSKKDYISLTFRE
ncbi:TPR repeat-containing protein [Flavisolibacter ginsengisoli DSM 18119]|uniref:TPR repeat-containing protein n=2 Tax=Flavisolibacter TaxID=398041 RepID=A0A1M5BS60_9BACT|nr:TPR repeat-containing protein [Flavisolibacter ginsengisoli DSM 18119]